MIQDVLSVTQISSYLQALMDGDDLLNAVTVRGEISNYKLYPSGHHYFSLKDENATIRCVMFKGNAFRLRFRPENGKKVIAFGRITVYPRDGAYQLYCTTMLPDGVGDLHAAFEQTKTKLSAEGLFDPGHKKHIPKYPNTVVIVTSAAGAAIHDILRVIGNRWPMTKIRLLPVRVQGEEAPKEIAGAIAFANTNALGDVLIVGRGGGSMEDLWAFNTETVARSIFHSQIPVISAVGHEPDVTIADYVADLRAATPSNAGELVVPDQNALQQQLDQMQQTLAAKLWGRLQASKRQCAALRRSKALSAPEAITGPRRSTLALLEDRLIHAQTQFLERKRLKFVADAAMLDALSPLKVLSRGYGIVTTGAGSTVSRAQTVREGDAIRVQLQDGAIHAKVTHVEEVNR